MESLKRIFPALVALVLLTACGHQPTTTDCEHAIAEYLHEYAPQNIIVVQPISASDDRANISATFTAGPRGSHDNSLRHSFPAQPFALIYALGSWHVDPQRTATSVTVAAYFELQSQHNYSRDHKWTPSPWIKPK